MDLTSTSPHTLSLGSDGTWHDVPVFPIHPDSATDGDFLVTGYVTTYAIHNVRRYAAWTTYSTTIVASERPEMIGQGRTVVIDDKDSAHVRFFRKLV